jgi:hypothetical protein
MPKWSVVAVLISVFLSGGPAIAAGDGAGAGEGESLVSSMCRLVDSSARAQGLPVSFLTRLIWQESSFQPKVSSPAGAQGVAQFMPETAGARGLADPFDPEAAIPKAASLLAELRRQFGNLGLAAAAYNAGPARVAKWLEGGELPLETQNYVSIITRHSIDEWAAGAATKLDEDKVFPDSSCVQSVAAAGRSEPPKRSQNEKPVALSIAHSSFSAPWGVQLAGSFNKNGALQAYLRARGAYASILAGVQPMIIGGFLGYRDSRPYYRVRAPAATRAAADALCDKLLKAGGTCVVLRNVTRLPRTSAS